METLFFAEKHYAKLTKMKADVTYSPLQLESHLFIIIIIIGVEL